MKLLFWTAGPIALLALLFAAGFSSPSMPEPPASVVRGASSATAGAVIRPGETAVAAVAFFRTLRSDPPPPPPPPPPPHPPPPPPPPDVAETFRAAFRGVQRNPDTGQISALVTLGSGTVGHLAEGSPYGDGWIVKSVTHNTVTLAKGQETRLISVFG